MSKFTEWESRNKEQFDEQKKVEIENLKRKPAVRPWDLLNPNETRAAEEVANLRYDICKECPMLIKISKQCRKCGCFMAAKTKLLHATCPLNKW
jgi:hypothetical protein